MSAEDFTWTPDPAIVAESNLVAFMKRHGIDDYDALMARAEADPDWYWNAVLEENDYRFYKPYDREGTVEDAMNQYLDWEIELINQIKRDGTLVFPEFAP